MTPPVAAEETPAGAGPVSALAPAFAPADHSKTSNGHNNANANANANANINAKTKHPNPNAVVAPPVPNSYTGITPSHVAKTKLNAIYEALPDKDLVTVTRTYTSRLHQLRLQRDHRRSTHLRLTSTKNHATSGEQQYLPASCVFRFSLGASPAVQARDGYAALKEKVDTTLLHCQTTLAQSIGELQVLEMEIKQEEIAKTFCEGLAKIAVALINYHRDSTNPSPSSSSSKVVIAKTMQSGRLADRLVELVLEKEDTTDLLEFSYLFGSDNKNVKKNGTTTTTTTDNKNVKKNGTTTTTTTNNNELIKLYYHQVGRPMPTHCRQQNRDTESSPYNQHHTKFCQGIQQEYEDIVDPCFHSAWRDYLLARDQINSGALVGGETISKPVKEASDDSEVANNKEAPETTAAKETVQAPKRASVNSQKKGGSHAAPIPTDEALKEMVQAAVSTETQALRQTVRHLEEKLKATTTNTHPNNGNDTRKHENQHQHQHQQKRHGSQKPNHQNNSQKQHQKQKPASTSATTTTAKQPNQNNNNTKPGGTTFSYAATAAKPGSAPVATATPNASNTAGNNTKAASPKTAERNSDATTAAAASNQKKNGQRNNQNNNNNNNQKKENKSNKNNQAAPGNGQKQQQGDEKKELPAEEIDGDFTEVKAKSKGKAPAAKSNGEAKKNNENKNSKPAANKTGDASKEKIITTAKGNSKKNQNKKNQNKGNAGKSENNSNGANGTTTTGGGGAPKDATKAIQTEDTSTAKASNENGSKQPDGKKEESTAAPKAVVADSTGGQVPPATVAAAAPTQENGENESDARMVAMTVNSMHDSTTMLFGSFDTSGDKKLW